MRAHSLFDFSTLLFWREGFEADDGDDEGGEEEEAPEGGGLVEDEDAQQYRAEGADAGPYRIGGADGQHFGGFGQQHGAEDVEEGESGHPLPPRESDEPFGFAETEGEAYFAKACYDEYNPMHFV